MTKTALKTTDKEKDISVKEVKEKKTTARTVAGTKKSAAKKTTGNKPESKKKTEEIKVPDGILSEGGVGVVENKIEYEIVPKKSVLFIASEANPFAGTGGLADVIGSLPKTLAMRWKMYMHCAMRLTCRA